MTRTSKSVLYFSFYMEVVGILMIIFPQLVLRILSINTDAGVVVRFLGMVDVFMGYYYLRAGIGKDKLKSFYRLTIHTRFAAIVLLVLFVIVWNVNPIVILFGLIDTSGAVWTIVSMRLDKRANAKNDEAEQVNPQ